ncbi:MAG: glycosyltransferase family 4 protein [Kiritimatiellae bacterium]|nr:glycosyltransferase family 4 protein [Kiritimatiellia bacterium]
MMAKHRIYFHTNVPAPYRKHQFELIAKRFPDAVFFLTEKQAGYRPWSNSVKNWKANIWHVTQMQLLLSLFVQRWGSIHICGGGLPKWYWVLLMVSGMIGQSKVIGWNDGSTLAQVKACKSNTGENLPLKKRVVKWLVANGMKAVFTPGVNGADMARAKGFRDNQIINAYFSHDIDAFAKYDEEYHDSVRKQIRQAYEIANDTIVLLCISRYLDLKRLEDLAEALLILERSHLDEANRCELLLIGDGSYKTHLPILKKLTNVKVHLVKQMPPENVLAYYCASDIFVFPSEGDIWGLVVNEALSMGLPVICTDEIGAAELVQNGENGYKVPVRQPKIIAEKIHLMLNADRRQALSKAAKKIRETWRTELGVAELQRFIENIG